MKRIHTIRLRSYRVVEYLLRRYRSGSNNRIRRGRVQHQHPKPGGGKPRNLQPRHTHRTTQRELDSRRPVPKLTGGRRVQPRALAPCRQNPAEEHQGGRDHRGPDGRRRRRQRSQPAHRRTGVTRPGRTACPSR